MKKLILSFSVFLSVMLLSSLIAQIVMLKPIEISKRNKFYQDDHRLRPGKPLELALAKANNPEVNALFKKGKKATTIGNVLAGVGVAVMAVGLAKTASNASNGTGSSTAGYTLGGATLLLTGVIVTLPALKNKKKAVIKYNDIVRNR